MQFAAVVWKEGKQFVSQCLNVDISSFGSTKREALENLEEALLLYLEDFSKKLPKVETPVLEIRTLQHA